MKEKRIPQPLEQQKMPLLESQDFGFICNREDPVYLHAPLAEQLVTFRGFGKDTRVLETRAETFSGNRLCVPTYVNEFWTAKQRAASSLHEISYRACFKPQLPRFFIDRLTD